MNNLEAIYRVWLDGQDCGPFRMVDLIEMANRAQLGNSTPVRLLDATTWSSWNEVRPSWAELRDVREANAPAVRHAPSVVAKEVVVRKSLRATTAYPLLRLCMKSLVGFSLFVVIVAWGIAFSLEPDGVWWTFFAIYVTCALPVSLVGLFVSQALLDIADCALKKQE